MTNKEAVSKQWDVYQHPDERRVARWFINEGSLPVAMFWEESACRLAGSAPELYEELLIRFQHDFAEDDHYSADHLLYSCNECEHTAEDDYMKVVHADLCDVGKTAALIARATGAAS